MKILTGLFCFLALALTVSAQTKVVPIIEMKVGGLLGGAENGKWLDAKTTFSNLQGNEKFSLFNFKTGKRGEISLGKINQGPEVCEENYYIEPDTKITANFAVGTSANWEIMPRLPKSVSLNGVSSIKSVSDVLKSKRLLKSPAKIKQAYRIDLDGDGVDEVVLLANLYELDKNKNPKIGNYSFVSIRKIIKGKAQTIFVTGNFENGNYDGGIHELSAIADLNGDGKLELMVSVFAYNGEEHWVNVFEMKSGKPTEIKALYFYCGV